MSNCGQACPYNTLDGCKVKEHNAICPLTNMATPIKEYRMTNADRIRAMSDEELTKAIGRYMYCGLCPLRSKCNTDEFHTCSEVVMDWLQQPAEECQ